MNVPIGLNHRSELETNAKTRGIESSPSKGPVRWAVPPETGIRRREEAGLLTIHGNQIGFGQDLQQVLLLKALMTAPIFNIRSRNKEISGNR